MYLQEPPRGDGASSSVNFPLTSDMFTFLDMRAMLLSEAVSVPTFVLGSLRGSTATSDLVANTKGDDRA